MEGVSALVSVFVYVCVTAALTYTEEFAENARKMLIFHHDRPDYLTSVLFFMVPSCFNPSWSHSQTPVVTYSKSDTEKTK